MTEGSAIRLAWCICGFDVHRLVCGALRSLCDGIAAPGVAGAFTAVAYFAESDPKMAIAMASIPASWHAALNQLLQPAGLNISQDDYAVLPGPGLYRLFWYRRAVSDEFTHRIVSTWLFTISKEPRQSVATSA